MRGCPAGGRLCHAASPRSVGHSGRNGRFIRPPERVRAAVFVKHPAFFDACDELQVKYEMLRAHFLDGEPVTTVCAAFGYSRQTFYLLRDRLARRGLVGQRQLFLPVAVVAMGRSREHPRSV